jgi:hypothetical protein
MLVAVAVVMDLQVELVAVALVAQLATAFLELLIQVVVVVAHIKAAVLES